MTEVKSLVKFDENGIPEALHVGWHMKLNDNRFDRASHDLHLYLIPFENWEATKQKILKKIHELDKATMQRSQELSDLYLNTKNIPNIKVSRYMLGKDEKQEDQPEEFKGRLQEQIHQYDLSFRQKYTALEQLCNYIKNNEYLDGVKISNTVLSYVIQNKIKCVNCGHAMYYHSGEWSEKECGHHKENKDYTRTPCPKNCTKFVMKPEHKLMLQRMSGTKPYPVDLAGKIVLPEEKWLISNSASPALYLDPNGIAITCEQHRQYQDEPDEDFEDEFEEDENDEIEDTIDNIIPEDNPEDDRPCTHTWAYQGFENKGKSMKVWCYKCNATEVHESNEDEPKKKGLELFC